MNRLHREAIWRERLSRFLPPELVVLQQTWHDGAFVVPYYGQSAGATAGVQVGLGDCVLIADNWRHGGVLYESLWDNKPVGTLTP